MHPPVLRCSPRYSIRLELPELLPVRHPFMSEWWCCRLTAAFRTAITVRECILPLTSNCCVRLTKLFHEERPSGSMGDIANRIVPKALIEAPRRYRPQWR